MSTASHATSPGTMRAVRAVRAGEPFVSGAVPVPEPGRGQVRVQVKACGICAGDGIARKAGMGIVLPRTPGHEIAGIVDAVGDGVTAVQPGLRVGVGWHGGHCFVCEFCRAGDFVNCVELKIVGVHYDGGYAEYLLAPQAALARLPDALTFAEAAPLMCAGVTTFNALRHSGAGPGDTVAVQGVGGLGHLGIQYADKMGYRVVAISRGTDKEKVARELGADEYIDSRNGSAGAVLTALGGASAILSTAGDAAAQADLAQGLRPNGRLMVLASAHEPIPVAGRPLVLGRRAIQGWASGHAKDSEEAMAFTVLTGIRPMIETCSLDQAEQAYQALSKARFRNVVTF